MNGGGKRPGIPSNLQTPEAGAFALNDWLGQTDNEATVQAIETVLLPTQEMMPFQRKIRQVLIQVSPGIGQVPIISGKVPRNESWLLHRASAETSEGHFYTFSVLPLRNGSILHKIGNFSLETGIQTPLYPSRWEQTVNNNERFNMQPGYWPEFMPGDLVQFNTSEVAVAAHVVKFQMRYEVRPVPNLFENDEVFAGQTI